MNKIPGGSKNMKISKMDKFYKYMRTYSWKLIRSVLITGICFIIIYPFLMKLSSSFMVRKEIFDMTVKWIPKNPTLKNYYQVFISMNYLKSLKNSLILTVTVSCLQLISCTVIGYGFARFKFKGKGLAFGLVIFTLLVPPQLNMTPLYLNFRFFNFFGLLGKEGINLINSYWPFILTSLTGTAYKNGLFIFIMRQFFRGMPTGLEEAAYVDGAGPLKTFFKVMLPGALPAMLIVFLFSFVWQWNDLLYTSLFISGGDFLPFSLSNIINDFQRFSTSVLGKSLTAEKASIVTNTGVVMFILPLLVLYGFLQRYFIESIERTGLVG